MTTTPTKQKGRGFTIIEVMIVLTIAGLILLIVFLAVPALQRNSRNTQRRSDVAKMLAAVAEYRNNNTSYPATGQFDTQFGTVSPTLSQYAYGATTTTWDYSAAARGVAPAAVTATDTVKVYNYLKCSNNTPTTTAASPRSIIALYAVESGGATGTAQCVES